MGAFNAEVLGWPKRLPAACATAPRCRARSGATRPPRQADWTRRSGRRRAAGPASWPDPRAVVRRPRPRRREPCRCRHRPSPRSALGRCARPPAAPGSRPRHELGAYRHAGKGSERDPGTEGGHQGERGDDLHNGFHGISFLTTGRAQAPPARPGESRGRSDSQHDMRRRSPRMPWCQGFTPITGPAWSSRYEDNRPLRAKVQSSRSQPARSSPASASGTVSRMACSRSSSSR